MEDNSQEVESTEVVVEREPAQLSIREKLKQELQSTNNTQADETSAEETSQQPEQATPVEQVVQQERPMLVPPSDMNSAEKDAFLNPTAQNAHVLQGYLNRRAYETRMQYDRKMQEVNQLYKQNQTVYDTIKQYEEEYARQGISIGDIARRSIAWDKAMKNNPYQTALEWLQSYNIDVNDLTERAQQQYQQPPQYLTKEEAERIAIEKYQSIADEQDRKALELYNERVVEYFMNSKPLFKDAETASQLEAEMAPVVQALNNTGRYSSAEEVLETAYNYVVNGNPTFSGIMQKMTTGPVVQQQQAVAQKARQAAKSISGSAGSGTPRVHAQTIRDNLRRRFHGE